MCVKLRVQDCLPHLSQTLEAIHDDLQVAWKKSPQKEVAHLIEMIIRHVIMNTCSADSPMHLNDLCHLLNKQA